MEPQLAKIAVRPDGFVDGASFTDNPESAAFLNEMAKSGMKIFELPRGEAKALWGEFLPADHPLRQQLTAAA